ncbi:MAG: hypothetical protein AB7O97_21060 [Planctomycetota bacterium]
MVLRISTLPALLLAAVVPLQTSIAQAADAHGSDAKAPAAQDPQGSGKPTEPASEADKVQEPRGQSPADRIGELRRELERLKKEIQFVRDRVSGSTDELRDKLHNRNLDVRAIDAGRASGMSSIPPSAAAPIQRREARLMDEAERNGLPENILMQVGGSLVNGSEYQQLLDYLATLPGVGGEPERRQRALLELVRIHAVLGSFPESMEAGMERIRSAATELAEGAQFDAVRAQYDTSKNIGKDGKVQITRLCPYGLFVEMAAFATEIGKVSTPVRGLTGYVLVAVDGITRGETSQHDVVDARILIVPYHDNPAELDAVRLKAATGQVDVAVRTQELLDGLPAVYRVQAMKPVEEKPVDVKPGEIKPGQPQKGGLQPASLEPAKEAVEEEPAKKGGDGKDG